MTIVFVSGPFSIYLERCVLGVWRTARELTLASHRAVTPQVHLLTCLDETAERNLAMRLCWHLLVLCEAGREFGKPSAGVRLESAEAERLVNPVIRQEVP